MPSSLQSTPRFPGQVTTPLGHFGQKESHSLHHGVGGSSTPTPAAVWFCKGGYHHCKRDCSCLFGHCCDLPNAGMEPYLSPVYDLLKLARNCGDRSRIWWFSFVLLSCSLPQVALTITKVSVSKRRLCSWEMGGTCPETSELFHGLLVVKKRMPRCLLSGCAVPSPWAFAAPMNCFNPLTSSNLSSSSPLPQSYFSAASVKRPNTKTA